MLINAARKTQADVQFTVKASLILCMREHIWEPLPEVLAQGRGVVCQKSVDQTKQLHDSLILPQVFVALQQEHELVAITACRWFNKHSTDTRLKIM